MKEKAKKWVAVLAAVVLLTAAVSPTVFALDFFGTFDELLGGDFGDVLGELLGGNRGNTQQGFSLSDLLSNPGGILDTLRERLADLDINVSNSTIAEAIMALLNGNSVGDLRSLLNSNEFINQLADYLQRQQETSTAPTESTTAEEPTTAPPDTTESPYNDDIDVPSIVIPSITYTYTYQGAQTYSTETTTAVTESSTQPSYSYVETSAYYTNPLTTVPFTPVYEDNTAAEKNGSTAKLIVGILVLLASGGAIAAILIMLKKNKD